MRRRDEVHPPAQFGEERVRAVAQHRPGDFAAGHDASGERVVDAHGPHPFARRRRPARRVGQQHRGLAQALQAREAVHCAGIGRDAIMDHPPKIDHEGLVSVGQVREAVQMQHVIP